MVTQPSRWCTLAGSQEAELASLFAPNASFTDQLGSGGHASSYLDFGSGLEATASQPPRWTPSADWLGSSRTPIAVRWAPRRSTSKTWWAITAILATTA